jgi:hypothetical protein
MRIDKMAASTTDLSIAALAPDASIHDVGLKRRRISPESGRALEILGHAIEYLADEYIHSGALPSANDGPVKAMQMLMALNRQIYLSCPVRPTLWERLRSFMRVQQR